MRIKRHWYFNAYF